MKINELGKILTSLSSIHDAKPSDTEIEYLYFDADAKELNVSTSGNGINITTTLIISQSEKE